MLEVSEIAIKFQIHGTQSLLGFVHDRRRSVGSSFQISEALHPGRNVLDGGCRLGQRLNWTEGRETRSQNHFKASDVELELCVALSCGIDLSIYFKQPIFHIFDVLEENCVLLFDFCAILA